MFVPFKIFLITMLALCQLTLCQDFNLAKSTISYDFKFMMKTVKGESDMAKGKGKCAGDSCSFLIAVPVKTFDSGNTNRDLNMLNATKAKKHPMVALKVRFATPKENGTILLETLLKFAGVEKKMNIKSTFKQIEKDMSFTGNFKILLSEFKIERPSLLSMKIPDEINIRFITQWE